MASAAALPLLLPGVGFASARAAHAHASARAVLAPPRSLCLRPARARLAALSVGTPPRSVSVRCAPKMDGFIGGAPAPKNIHGPALNALKRAAADAFRPLQDNLDHIRSLKNITYVNDYNIGMPFGFAVASLGCYQLFRAAPCAFLDLALGYLFYKLSVVSSQVHRQGFANDFITMIQVAISIVMVIKLCESNFEAFGLLRLPVLDLYFTTFYGSVKGWKEEATYELRKFYETLQASIGA